ncbi:hypothetical protein HQ520_06445 [bacterium]|nr:hypothetical protein [bacterium]
MTGKLLGSRTWFFPDGDIPQAGDGEQKGHESLIILNPNPDDADVTITVYYSDDPPHVLPPQSVPGERVRCIRTNEPIEGYQIPFGQYALKLESTIPIVAQIGRMDVSQANLAYYTVMGFGG